MTDKKVLERLNDFEQRFYGLYVNGMTLSCLSKLTLDDEGLAKKWLALIEKKIWLAAPRLAAPRVSPPEQPQPKQPKPKSLRLRAGLSVRETAKLLDDARIAKVVGPEARFYRMYASNNTNTAELAKYVGTTDGVGVRVYAQKVENTIIQEALSLKLIKDVVPPPPEDVDAHYESVIDADHRMSDTEQRIKHFAEEGEPSE